ncbi:ABC transporter ATP-binding protein [Myceligenerans xiligouense]|uniref:ABC-type polysaccharide/polyol phosphate transport system ATPase subunit n=1 Tax=Myceligenerans xiligouense TaxID=253184 RepID=A0A3N4YJ51_9MICO|nr:ABC-type polysaccharide/polyol phosphate transport system ATPase subunit [Myceligenerans xiligouense]
MTENVPSRAPKGEPEEIDFEIDAEDLPDRAVRTELGSPSVIVDDVHVTYRVFGGKPVSGANRSLFNRMVGRARQSVGAITEVRAVRGVSFVARHGEAIGIVGTNGSGKSTLLRAVAGLHPPSKGRVYLSGEPSLLGVNAALLKDLSGERNITIGGLALGMSEDEARAKVPEIVDFADLGDFVYLPMNAYSSGMAARLRFAISTIVTPDILMVDEALATGDAAFRKKSKERIEKIREEAGTVFLVSHSIASVRAMCTRVIWLDQGQVRMDGDVDTVCDEYQKYIKGKNGQAKAGGKIGPGGRRKGAGKGRGAGKGKPKTGNGKRPAKVAGQHKQYPRPAEGGHPATGSLRRLTQDDLRPATGSLRQVPRDETRPATGPLRKVTPESSRPAASSRPATGALRRVTEDDPRPSTGTLRRLTWEDVRPDRVSGGFSDRSGGGDADPLAAPETRPVVEPALPRVPRWPSSTSETGFPDLDGPTSRSEAELRRARRSWVGQRRPRSTEPAPDTEAIPVVRVTDPRDKQGEG